MNIGIVGYGNLGKGVEAGISKNEDIRLVAVFSRRPPESIKTRSNVPVFPLEKAISFKDKIDVMILCGGSATDLPVQGPLFAKDFSTVDSFDTHANIPDYHKEMDSIARENNNLSLISCGWDPGIFSLARTLFTSVIPEGSDYTFWGKGVSQGHSDAIRRIEGVKDARQYTVPVEEAMKMAKGESRPELSTAQKHIRLCYVVAEENADKDSIRERIVNMPNYFADYKTEVNFISEKEMKENHSSLPHGGVVIRNGETSPGQNQVAELSLNLSSNPQFTASVLLAYARAVHKMRSEGKTGAISVLDVPFAALSPMAPEELLNKIL